MLALAACGSSTPSTTPTPTPTPTSQPSSSASPSSASGSGAYVLSTGQLPSGTESWQQVSDGTLNNNASTDQRAWQNADNTQRIEIDVFVETSSAAAEGDYMQWSSAIQQKATSITARPACAATLQIVSLCDELIGQTTDGKSQDLMTWQQERVLVAVFLVNANTTADQSYFEKVCVAENQALSNIVGP